MTLQVEQPEQGTLNDSRSLGQRASALNGEARVAGVSVTEVGRSRKILKARLCCSDVL